MQFKKDADVFAANGEHVGQIDRVVIDPHTKQLSQVVVRKGWFFTEDKVVPVEMIAGTTEDKVTLRQDAGELEDLPDFQETHYVAASEEELARGSYTAPYIPSLYWYPPAFPLGGYPAPGYFAGAVEPGYVVETEQNIPEGTVALKEGAKVIAADGDQVGNIEQLVADSKTDRITHLVISQGLFLKEKKLVPSNWIETVDEGEVHLAVGSHIVDDLRSYEP